MGRISILTGEIGTGKTSLCLALAEQAKQEGLSLAGLLSPGVFLDGEKTAIDVLDLQSGQRRRLADRKTDQASEIETQRWAFREEAVSWGNHRLGEAGKCDLLLIDELGPLEFIQGLGWVNGFKVLGKGEYQNALVVVRPSLLEEAHKRWHISQLVDLRVSSWADLPPLEVYSLLTREG